MSKESLADMCSSPADPRRVHIYTMEGVPTDLRDAAHCGTSCFRVPQPSMENAVQFGKSGDKQATYQAVFNAFGAEPWRMAGSCAVRSSGAGTRMAAPT